MAVKRAWGSPDPLKAAVRPFLRICGPIRASDDAPSVLRAAGAAVSDYEWLSIAGRASPGYATMTHEELMALDVAQWSKDNSHLYLWVTNSFMKRGVELMKHWGWQHKTVLTWVKPRWGLGSYFRNSTGHVLFGVRGQMRDVEGGVVGTSRVARADRVSPMPGMDQRMDDVRAVMDAADSRKRRHLRRLPRRIADCIFAAIYPERCRALVLYELSLNSATGFPEGEAGSLECGITGESL